ncbi:MAG: hypothetical protein HUU60_04800 [Armatimonadetes bacterium]|nr:hypothetical protein [Armatimonadota bacterium]
MQFRDAQQYVGYTCEVAYKDRHGDVLRETMHIVDVSYVPMYGLCMLTDVREVRLDRIVEVQAIDMAQAA